MPPILPVIHVMYFLLSTDIITYFGGWGGGTGLRMNDDGQWCSACAMIKFSIHTHTHSVTGPCLLFLS